jgi:hypothetical protein
MVEGFTPVRLLNATLNARDEAGLIVKQPVDRALHQLLNILAIGGGDLRQPRFDVG